jgi:hypothetical protein
MTPISAISVRKRAFIFSYYRSGGISWIKIFHGKEFAVMSRPYNWATCFTWTYITRFIFGNTGYSLCSIISHHFTETCWEDTSCCGCIYTRHAYKCVDRTWRQIYSSSSDNYYADTFYYNCKFSRRIFFRMSETVQSFRRTLTFGETCYLRLQGWRITSKFDTEVTLGRGSMFFSMSVSAGKTEDPKYECILLCLSCTLSSMVGMRSGIPNTRLEAHVNVIQFVYRSWKI